MQYIFRNPTNGFFLSVTELENRGSSKNRIHKVLSVLYLKVPFRVSKTNNMVLKCLLEDLRREVSSSQKELFYYFDCTK